MKREFQMKNMENSGVSITVQIFFSKHPNSGGRIMLIIERDLSPFL